MCLGLGILGDLGVLGFGRFWWFWGVFGYFRALCCGTGNFGCILGVFVLYIWSFGVSSCEFCFGFWCFWLGGLWFSVGFGVFSFVSVLMLWFESVYLLCFVGFDSCVCLFGFLRTLVVYWPLCDYLLICGIFAFVFCCFGLACFDLGRRFWFGGFYHWVFVIELLLLI